ncbi:ABC transporter permease [Marinitenerispora sediminis]|uniref:Autoinducer 2 import system permease protein LsrD n=1 Tax=Marinitenerispora sediminis TaxID=1931232 RepID=A0A368T8K3_9ACTN|nr:ABC transporter permease [Marinitenerispora sediminis]RCV53537.1 ATPase [Marinitenerispora sediminis]RCV57693.1 ATPase [Marinitenerispora sediminis]RCV60750.1 ATPase [Marinitenerispora sediminis]
MTEPHVSARPAPPPGPARRPALLAGVPARRETSVAGALLVSVLAASLLVDGFATGRNAGFLILDVAAVALIALPMTLVIVTGEIDLSVASTLGLTSAVLGRLWLAGLALELIVPLCLLLGALLGLMNGLLVTVARLPSLAVTIGTMALYRGLAYVVLGDRAVADFPFSWTGGAVAALPGTPVPWVALLIAGLAAAFGVLLHATAFGRSLFAIGSNADAAAFAGIPVLRAKLWLFVATGAMAALAGVFWTMQYGSARADNATGLELSVVAAVLLGGVSIFGGVGALPGVLAGVLLLGTIRNALQLADVPSDTLTVVTGLLLIVSVVVPNLLARAREHRRRRRSAPAGPG